MRTVPGAMPLPVPGAVPGPCTGTGLHVIGSTKSLENETGSRRAICYTLHVRIALHDAGQCTRHAGNGGY